MVRENIFLEVRTVIHLIQESMLDSTKSTMLKLTEQLENVEINQPV